MKKLLLMGGSAFLVVSQINIANPLPMPSESTIKVIGVGTFCNNKTPFLRVMIQPNDADVGLKGLVFAGAHDKYQNNAEFYVGENNWVRWRGGLFPVYQIFQEGLENVITLTIPLNDYQKSGWRMYVGYGALTSEKENLVQRSADAVAKVKAKFPNKPVHTVDSDHFRRALAQENMTTQSKYAYVFTWTPKIYELCEKNGGGK